VTAIWTTLGLKRTSDVAEIRRAYARKLKQTDVDGNPEAFIALRQALERALQQARYGQHRARAAAPNAFEKASPDLQVAIREAAPVEAAVPTEEALPSAPSREEPAVPPETKRGIPIDQIVPDERWIEEPAVHASARPDGHEQAEINFAELDRLLYADAEAWPHPDALVAAVRAILDHPDMENVDRHAGVGRWLAGTLAHAIPRSDPALSAAAEHFGWGNAPDQWDQPWEIVAVSARARALRAWEQLSDPSHAYHRAWRELTSEEPKLGLSRFWMTSKVGRLLGIIRRECPELESMLAPTACSSGTRR
jgi:hypothetical protein